VKTKKEKWVKFELNDGDFATIKMSEKEIKANVKAGGFMMLPKEIINDFEDKYGYNPNILWFDRNEFKKVIK